VVNATLWPIYPQERPGTHCIAKGKKGKVIQLQAQCGPEVG